MFGHQPLLERTLRKHGRRALAKIREVQRTHYTETIGNDAVVVDTRRLWKLAIQVEPDGQPPFETRVETFFGQSAEPAPSDDYALVVLYDPGDHSRVIVDHSEEGRRLLDDVLTRQRADGRTERMRGRGQNVIADRYAQIHDPALGLFGAGGLSADPAERKRQLAERRAKIKEIMAGQTAEDRIALIRESMAGADVGATPAAMSESGLVPGSRPAPPDVAPATATVDALAKLADLRHRGLLTDEEFRAQKQKLLDE
jgi:hypothetical protein